VEAMLLQKKLKIVPNKKIVPQQKRNCSAIKKIISPFMMI